MAEKCKKCNCKCHCNQELHADVYGVCTCESCTCGKEAGGVVVDDTEECLSCQ